MVRVLLKNGKDFLEFEDASCSMLYRGSEYLYIYNSKHEVIARFVINNILGVISEDAEYKVKTKKVFLD